MTILLVACSKSKALERPASPGIAATKSAETPAATPSPSPGSPSALPSAVLTLLRRYALAQADLPPGYNIGGILEVPNQQAASDYGDPQQAAQEIADTGRQGGLGQQIFPPPTVAGSIGVSIELFKDAVGAQHWTTDPPPLQKGYSATSADPGSFGEAASAIHWTQGAQSGYVLNFSRGRIVYGIGIAAPAGQESLAPAQELARSLDQKAQHLSD